MERYEYKLVPMPSRNSKFNGLPESHDAFAQTLGEGMNALGREGWEFLRIETVVEKRNVLDFSSTRRRQDYMIYRRPLRSGVVKMDQPDRSRRVNPQKVPDSAQLKSRINALVLDEKTRAPGKSSQRSRVVTPFDIIRSKLN